jgi:hypothetical protein
MSKSTYLLKLPTSVKTAAARLAKAEGVSLNQFIASAVAEKVGVIETAREFLEQRAGHAKPKTCSSTCAGQGGSEGPNRTADDSWMKFEQVRWLPSRLIPHRHRPRAELQPAHELQVDPPR